MTNRQYQAIEARAIYKYTIEPPRTGRVATVRMKQGAEILTVQTQGRNVICLWAIIDTEAAEVPRKIDIMGTGWDFEPKGKYLGTVQVDEGPFYGNLVFHLFDLGEE